MASAADATLSAETSIAAAKENEEKAKKKMYQKLQTRGELEKVWKKVDENAKRAERPKISRMEERSRWQTVRIFVSSTFTDFHSEREALVKQVFPELRTWCERENRRLHIYECDLRWGVPAGTASDVTVRTCLEEINECRRVNGMPYFINMISKRTGWIPLPGISQELSALIEQFQLEFGLSVTEMEIVHAAYRLDNPRALFMIRDNAGVADEPPFVDNNEDDINISEYKLAVLKDKISHKFSEAQEVGARVYKCRQVETYRCRTIPLAPGEIRRRLEFLPDDDVSGAGAKLKTFQDKVTEFLKERIAAQYPPIRKSEDADDYVIEMQDHEDFMRAREEIFVGQTVILTQIEDYIHGNDDVPLIVHGKPGTGKTSVMASAVSKAVSAKHFVFCHFTGAVPNSTSLHGALCRLLNTISPDSETPTRLEEASQLVRAALSTGPQRKQTVVIFIDALNQMDDVTTQSTDTLTVTWLPEKLSSGVRVVVSMVTESPCQRLLVTSRRPRRKEIEIRDLSDEDVKTIVKQFFRRSTKELDVEQMAALLEKKSSKNPLWLSVACEELRVFGDFRRLKYHLEDLADDLERLLKGVLERHERETKASLVKKTLCFIKASRCGLLETELRELLKSDPSDYSGSPDEDENQLLAFDWAIVCNSLRTFLRPFGNPGEGRLNFYHVCLGEAVEKLYMQSAASHTEYHQTLADYFSTVTPTVVASRKAEEYPCHLIKLGNMDRLKRFLLDWDMFVELFNDEHSAELLQYWRLVEGKDKSKTKAQLYTALLEKFELERLDKLELALRYETASRFLSQAGHWTESRSLIATGVQLAEQYQQENPKDDVSEQLMYLYGHLGHAIVKTFPGQQSKSQIPELLEAIDYHQKAIDLWQRNRENFQDRRHKRYRALQLMKKAGALGGIVDRGGAPKLSKKSARDQGLKDIEEAGKLYKEVGDLGQIPSTLLTKATLYRDELKKQLKLFDEAIDLCLQIHGEFHPLLASLYCNKAGAYEDAKKLENAFQWFSKAAEISAAVYGNEHAQTERYRNILAEARYAKFASKRT